MRRAVWVRQKAVGVSKAVGVEKKRPGVGLWSWFGCWELFEMCWRTKLSRHLSEADSKTWSEMVSE